MSKREELMNPIILLVDVASVERENWKAFLENQGYDVFTAENPESARQLCLQLQPDLVLLHDHLPQVRGRWSCSRTKSGCSCRQSWRADSGFSAVKTSYP